MSKQTFTVQYNIELRANDADEAADQAWEIMRDSDMSAVLIVLHGNVDHHVGKSYIDMR